MLMIFLCDDACFDDITVINGTLMTFLCDAVMVFVLITVAPQGGATITTTELYSRRQDVQIGSRVIRSR